MSYEDGDGEYCAIWEERWVRGRKSHRCCECGGKITVGERHGYGKGLMAGEGWQTFRRCAACMMLAEQVAQINGACPVWGGLDMSADDAGLESSYEHRERLESAPPAEEAP